MHFKHLCPLVHSCLIADVLCDDVICLSDAIGALKVIRFIENMILVLTIIKFAISGKGP
jgi:hypothetical protein